MDYSRTKPQPVQTAFVLQLFTISTSFAPLGLLCLGAQPGALHGGAGWCGGHPGCRGHGDSDTGGMGQHLCQCRSHIHLGWSHPPYIPTMGTEEPGEAEHYKVSDSGEKHVCVLSTWNCPCFGQGMSFFCFIWQRVFFSRLVINTHIWGGLLWKYRSSSQGLWIVIRFRKGSLSSLDLSCSKIPLQTKHCPSNSVAWSVSEHGSCLS